MSQIYKNTQFTPPTYFMQMIQISIVVAFLIVLSTISNAKNIDMDTVISDDANVSVALQWCEDMNGVYSYDLDICHID